MMLTDNTIDATELETMVDNYGLSGVLEALAYICQEKADHLSTNWQDARTAKVWMSDADRIQSVAVKVRAS